MHLNNNDNEIKRMKNAYAKSAKLKRIQIIAISFLTIAGFVNYIDRSALSIANSAIREEMALSPTEMGLLLSAFSLAYAFSQLPVGALLDRWGNRLVLGAGICFWSIAQLFCGLVNSFSQFMVARTILGIGESPLFPAGAKVVSEWFTVRERGGPTGIFIASSCIAPCLAPPLLTAIMLAFGWRWMFVFTGIAGLLVGIGWYAVYRNRSQTHLDENERLHLAQHEEVEQSSQKMTWKEWRSLFSHRTTWGMLLGFAGVIYMVWLYLTWLPSYLEHDRGLSVAHAGWVVAIPYVFGALGMICAGQIADYLSRRDLPVITSRKWTVCIGLLGGALATIPAAYTPDIVWAMVLISIAMFFINLASAACWTMVSVIAPKRKVASVGSIQNFGGYLGGSFAPVVTGWVVQTTGTYEGALVASGVIAVFGAIAYCVLVKEPIPATESPAPHLSSLSEHPQ